MSWIKVQRGVVDFGAGEDSEQITIATVGGLAKAFARITGVQFAAGGPVAGTTSDRNNDDLGATCKLTATDTITFSRESAGVDEDVRVYWEVWEYTGAPGGPNEFVVRYHDNVSVANGVAQQDQAVSGISSLGDCVPFICGGTAASTGKDWARARCTAKMVDASGDKVRLDRGDSVDNATVSVAVVEFTGSNWAVQNNIEHSQSVQYVDETETITDVVDWSQAFVVAALRTPGPALRAITHCVRRGASTTTLRFFSLASLNSVAHVVRNHTISVEHDDSITGSLDYLADGSASPQSLEITIGTCALSETAAFAYINSSTATTNYPQAHWLYRLQGATTLELWRARHGSGAHVALQVVDFSSLVIEPGFTVEAEDPKILAVSAVVPQLTVDRGALRTFRLGDDGDLYMASGRAVMLEGAAAAVQVIKGLLEVHVGEWLLDLSYGVPHLTVYHALYPDPFEIYASARAKIEALWFVSRVERLDFDNETDPEVLDVQFRVRLVDGTAAAGEARI